MNSSTLDTNATPRTDALLGLENGVFTENGQRVIELCRQLERELAASEARWRGLRFISSAELNNLRRCCAGPGYGSPSIGMAEPWPWY